MIRLPFDWSAWFRADPRALGLFRIAFGILALADLALRVPYLTVFYSDIGVLVADVNMTDPDITYKPAEREYRVPVSAIVKLKKVIS